MVREGISRSLTKPEQELQYLTSHRELVISESFASSRGLHSIH